MFEGADGTFLGKYDVPVERAGRWQLWAPSARSGPGAADVLGALSRHVVAEATRRGIERADLVLEGSHRHHDLVRSCLVDAGFDLAEQKFVFTRDLTALDSDRPAPDGLTTFRAATLAEGSDLLAAALHAEGEREGLEEWSAQVPCEFPGVVAVQDGALVGVALRSVRPGKRLLTLQHFGLVPGARGSGLGTGFLDETLHRAADAGFATYLGSTTTDNTAMQRVFERVGCERVGTRLILRWTPA